MASFAGYKLANARETRGWDQKTLAEQSGVSRSVVSALESGKTAHPRSVTVNLLAAALGIIPRELYKRRSPRRTTTTAAAPKEGILTDQEMRERGWATTAIPLPAPEPPEPSETPRTRQELDTLLHQLPHRWRILFDGCRGVGFDEAQAMRLVTAAITACALG